MSLERLFCFMRVQVRRCCATPRTAGHEGKKIGWLSQYYPTQDLLYYYVILDPIILK